MKKITPPLKPVNIKTAIKKWQMQIAVCPTSSKGLLPNDFTVLIEMPEEKKLKKFRMYVAWVALIPELPEKI